MGTGSKVLIAIPAHNEEASIGRTIEEVRALLPCFDILVIDDFSTDATCRIAEEKKALVVSLPFNMGIAGARQAGYRFAYDMGYDYLLQLDADGQHDPSYAMALLDAVKCGRADLIIGSRFLREGGYKVPFLRSLGIIFLARLISFLIKERITDSTSGFHAVNRKVISLYKDNYPYEYPEPEEIILLHRLGYAIAELPVAMRERESGASFLTPIISVYYMFEVVLAVMMAYIRKYPSKAEGE